VAFLLGSRVSEYSNTGRLVDHNLLSDNVYIITRDNEWINCCDIAKTGLLGGQLKSIYLSWSSTKNGKKDSFISQGISEFEDTVFDDLLAWCYSGSIETGAPLFSRVSEGKRRSLRRSDVSNFVKEMAKSMPALTLMASRHTPSASVPLLRAKASVSLGRLLTALSDGRRMLIVNEFILDSSRSLTIPIILRTSKHSIFYKPRVQSA